MGRITDLARHAFHALEMKRASHHATPHTHGSTLAEPHKVTGTEVHAAPIREKTGVLGSTFEVAAHAFGHGVDAAQTALDGLHKVKGALVAPHSASVGEAPANHDHEAGHPIVKITLLELHYSNGPGFLSRTAAELASRIGGARGGAEQPEKTDPSFGAKIGATIGAAALDFAATAGKRGLAAIFKRAK